MVKKKGFNIGRLLRFGRDFFIGLRSVLAGFFGFIFSMVLLFTLFTLIFSLSLIIFVVGGIILLAGGVLPFNLWIVLLVCGVSIFFLVVLGLFNKSLAKRIKLKW